MVAPEEGGAVTVTFADSYRQLLPRLLAEPQVRWTLQDPDDTYTVRDSAHRVSSRRLDDARGVTLYNVVLWEEKNGDQEVQAAMRARPDDGAGQLGPILALELVAEKAGLDMKIEGQTRRFVLSEQFPIRGSGINIVAINPDDHPFHMTGHFMPHRDATGKLILSVELALCVDRAIYVRWIAGG